MKVAHTVVLWVIWVVQLLRRVEPLINMNPDFGLWPNNEVPFYIDQAYTRDEQSQIRQAMTQILTDLKFCVKFTEVPENSPIFKVKITPTGPPGSPQGRCSSYPGRYRRNASNGRSEQPMVLARGATGCFDGSLHSLMKYFALVLGKRNEHQRTDRDQYIRMDLNNIQDDSKTAYRLYNPNEAFRTCSYDYCSITHTQPTDFAKAGQQCFTVRQAPFFIPKLDHLSTCDCQDIMRLYGCDIRQCPQVSCSSTQQGSGNSQGGSSSVLPRPPTENGQGVVFPAVVPVDATTVSSASGSGSGVSTTISPMGAQGTMICYNVPPQQAGGNSSVTVTTTVSPSMGSSGTPGVACTTQATTSSPGLSTGGSTASPGVGYSTAPGSGSSTNSASGSPATLASGSSTTPASGSSATGASGSSATVASGASTDSGSNASPTAGTTAAPRAVPRRVREGNLRTINTDSKFIKWPSNTVHYYIDSDYTASEMSLITAAMRKVARDLNGCVQFLETIPTNPMYKIKITKTSDRQDASQFCQSYPGAYRGYVERGRNEQALVLTNGPNGCFDGTLHSLMKYFAILLGKRNEHQRPDRDRYITVNQGAIRQGLETAYKPYESGVSSSCPYDYCSITHNRIDDFAATPGTPVFNVTNAPFSIPRQDQLSECDCKELSELYGCPVDRCAPTFCASMSGGSTPVPAGITGATASSLPTTVYPNLNGAVSMVCYLIPATTAPTTFTATIDLSRGTGSTVAGSSTTSSSASGQTSFTTVSPATTTCAPTDSSSPVTGMTTTPISNPTTATGGTTNSPSISTGSPAGSAAAASTGSAMSTAATQSGAATTVASGATTAAAAATTVAAAAATTARPAK